MSNIIAFQKRQKPKSVQEDITSSVLQLLLDKADESNFSPKKNNIVKFSSKNFDYIVLDKFYYSVFDIPYILKLVGLKKSSY